MTPEMVGVLGIVLMLVLLFLRVPVALTMMLVGCAGYAYITNPHAALTRLGQDVYRDGSSYGLSVVPMMIFMGMLLTESGLGRDLYTTLDRLLWRLRGGLAPATIGAAGMFGAVNHSAIATATTMSLVGVPEMKRLGYDRGFAGAVTAAGSSLGAIIPPSALLVLYSLLTNTNLSDVLVAAVIPSAITAIALVAATMWMIARKPELVPEGNVKPDIGIGAALLKSWPVPVLFGVVMGGIYAGIFTPTEAGAIGAFAALIYGVLTRRLPPAAIAAASTRTVRISAFVFLLIIGGKQFGYFLALSRIPSALGRWVSDSGLPAIVVLLAIFLVYFILGALMDESAILVIMTPIALPMILHFGYSPVWFGVVSCMMLLTGLITPPVGLLVFVVGNVAKIPMSEIYRKVLPLDAALCAVVVLLLAVPEIVMFLPDLRT